MEIATIVLGVLTVISAFGVISCTRPLNSALCLVATLFLVAAHYAVMGAHFVAALQVLVYAGAIVVLVVFVIMLLGIQYDRSDDEFSKPLNFAIATAVAGFLALLIVAFRQMVLPNVDSSVDAALVAQFGNERAIGQVLYTRYVFPFLTAGMLLLGAIIGAVLLAHEERRPLKEGRGLAAVRNRLSPEALEKDLDKAGND